MLVVKLQSFWRDETGATAIEYGLIAAMVAVAAIASFMVLGNSVVHLWNNGASEVMAAQAAKAR